MYFWNTGKLVGDLRNDLVTERNFKNYYMASSLIMMASYYLAMTAPRENMVIMLVEAIGSIIITVFGINYVFKRNGGDGGHSFVNRALALSLPLMIKLFLAGMLIGIIETIANELAIPKKTLDIAGAALLLLIQLVFFWRLAVHIQRVSVNVD